MFVQRHVQPYKQMVLSDPLFISAILDSGGMFLIFAVVSSCVLLLIYHVLLNYHFLFYFYLLLIMIHMCLIMILCSWHCYSSCLFSSSPFRLLFLFFCVLLHPCLAYSSCPVLFIHLIAFSCDCCHRHTCCSDPMCRHCLSANPHE